MAPPLVFHFIGTVFTAILYGFYCLIFALYWRIQLKRANGRKGFPLYALNLNFILCTIFFIAFIVQVQFDITEGVLNINSLDTALNWLIISQNCLYTAIDFNSQLILLYRCWVMWRKPWVMVIPCMLSLAFIATILTVLALDIKSVIYEIEGSKNTYEAPSWYYSAVTAFFFLSLAVNALVTALIVYRIITVYKDIREFNMGSQGSALGRRDLSPLISILIESGMITFVAQLIQAVMYKTATHEFPLISGSVVMLYGISTTIVLVRVEMGISYDSTTFATMTSINTRHPEPVRPLETWKAQSLVEGPD